MMGTRLVVEIPALRGAGSLVWIVRLSLPAVFALTMGLAAILLFSIQPMVAKMVLPHLGGSPAVWTTCMVFFQATLLAGYAYAHATMRTLGVRRQALWHGVLLALPVAFLPFVLVADGAPTVGNPTGWLLGRLLVAVGLPVFVVATTAPTFQRWFGATGHRAAADPYFLYGASNFGSLLALVAYPLLIEPNIPLARQGVLWKWGYCGLLALGLVCAGMTWWSAKGEPEEQSHDHVRTPAKVWLWWVVLAFLPSSLMLGLTTYLSTDIAPVPLLWVIPLALYLVTFIAAFARKPPVPHRWVVRAVPLIVMPLAFVLGLGLVKPFLIPLHLLGFFVVALACHGALALRRPDRSELTSFYLAIALGGVLGGVFNALVAPAIFNRIAEYPLVLILGCLAVTAPTGRWGVREWAVPLIVLLLTAGLVTGVGGGTEAPLGSLAAAADCGLVILACWGHRRLPARFALTMGAVLAASGLTAGVNGRVLWQERDFFGVSQVTHDERSQTHRFFHGRTLHGQQSLDPKRRREPLAYFRRSGPIGQVFEVFAKHAVSRDVAVVGLGAGALACYARPGERWTFYELDPSIVKIARDPRFFTFLSDAQSDRLSVVTGDARIRIGDAADHEYGLIVLDAFSADAVPVHLLTREALRRYRTKLAPGGLLAFNLSNRYLDLDPVLGALAREEGLVCRIRYDLTLTREQKAEDASIWGVLAAREEDLGAIASDPRWQVARVQGPAWTDDFSDLASHFTLGPRVRPPVAPAPSARAPGGVHKDAR